MALFGKIDQFDIHDDEFGEYLERVEQYFVAHDIVDDNKKVAVFITVIGKETYGVLRSLLAQMKPQDKNFKQISEELLRHLNPSAIVNIPIYACQHEALIYNSLYARKAGMQVYIYEDMQICRCAGMQVWRYAGMQVCMYACMNMQVLMYEGVQVCKYTGIQVCRYAGMQVFMYAGM